MANQEQLAILKQGVDVWNKWRENHIETIIDFSHADLSQMSLAGANLSMANFYWADLSGANLRGANLYLASLREASLQGANLTGASLECAHLVDTNVAEAVLSGCRVYGVSAWDLQGTPKLNTGLIVTRKEEPAITVDNLQMAQFIHLLLKNENLRNVIDTVTAKAVLILGRFTEERIAVLNAMRKELRDRYDFAPILFDFDKPATKDVTGTVETLARMARFIIADLTDPSSIPFELATLVPFLRTTPIQLIKLEGARTFSMIDSYIGKYPWLLGPHEYKDGASLIAELSLVIEPANQMAEAFRKQ